VIGVNAVVERRLVLVKGSIFLSFSHKTPLESSTGSRIKSLYERGH
jgi:hypothetical protein